jgi:formiminotetrahydrofolate cyclodeaminase
MDENRVELLETPTDQLLGKFGSGGHKPGSGSAAALLGLLSGKLVQTVVSLTTDRASYEEAQATLSSAVEVLVEQIEPQLTAAFEEDSRQFDRTIAARRLRNAAPKGSTERHRLSEEALSQLRASTEIPLEIAQLCLELGTHAVNVFDLGFRSARGDSLVAITSAHAAVGGCLGIIYLNLTSFRGGEWAQQARARADEIADRWKALGTQAEDRIATLREEVVGREPKDD